MTSSINIFRELIKYLLQEVQTSGKHVRKSSDFTHSTNLTFDKTFLCILTNISRTIPLELYGWYGQFTDQQPVVTPSAFCQARQKLKASAFVEVLTHFVRRVYHGDMTASDLATWRKYLVLAVDGSKFDLPDTTEVIDAYGGQVNQYGTVAMANVHARFDVLNGLPYDVSLNPYKSSERTNAIEQLASLADLPLPSISLYDRGYPSASFAYMHQHLGLKYVIRTKLKFNKVITAFYESGATDELVTFTLNHSHKKELAEQGISVKANDTFTVRLVRITLPDGTPEILMTNLWASEDITVADLAELYGMRWVIETFFDRLKNLYRGMVFSSRLVNGVEQEFYGLILLYFLNAFVIKSCASMVKQVNDRRTKTYQINHNTALGFLKLFLIPLMYSPNSDELLGALRHLFVQHLVIKEHKPRDPKKARIKIKRRKNTSTKNSAYSV